MAYADKTKMMEFRRQYYLKNKARILAQNEAWWKAHPEKRREKERRQYWANHSKKRAASARYRAANLEKVRKSRRDWQKNNWSYRQEYMRKYMEKNRDRVLAKKRARFHATKEQTKSKRKIQAKASYLKNIVARRAGERRYRQANKVKKCAWSAARRALKLKATINLAAITEWMSEVRSKKTAVCYYCHKIISTSTIHFDHIIPLTKGGEHSVRNLCVSCAPCNLSKNATLIHAWYKTGQQILGL